MVKRSLSKVPQRIVTIDINNTELVLTLGLHPSIVGVSGFQSKDEVREELRPLLKNIPILAHQYPGLETILAVNPDFVVAGWNYGFSTSRGIYPKKLKSFGVESYAIRESCIRVGQKNKATLDDVYTDIRALAKAFDIPGKGDQLIASLRQTLQKIKPLNKPAPRIFLFDSGEKTPFTAGGYAIPHAMIQQAGGHNIFGHLNSSWVTTSWEHVLLENPQYIIVVNYGGHDGHRKTDFLKSHPVLKNLEAVQQDRLLILPYAAVTPGIRNAEATLAIHQFIRR